MAEPIKNKKKISFSMNTKKLKDIYGEKRFTYGYKDIKEFFSNHGFKYTKDSGFVSSERLSHMEILDLVNNMRKEIPWLCDCISHLEVTDIGVTRNLSGLLVHDDQLSEIMEKNTLDVPETRQERRVYEYQRRSIGLELN